MPHPLVVHCKLSPYDIYIGRPSPWGNPWKVIPGKRSREEAILAFERMVCADQLIVDHIKKELRGKVLGCWCAPLPCHGDILAEIANQ